MTILGMLFVLIGLLIAAIDVAEKGGLQFRALGEWWFRLSPETLQLAQPAIERHVSETLWNDAVLHALQWPAAGVFIVLGVLLLLVKRLLA